MSPSAITRVLRFTYSRLKNDSANTFEELSHARIWGDEMVYGRSRDVVLPDDVFQFSVTKYRKNNQCNFFLMDDYY